MDPQNIKVKYKVESFFEEIRRICYKSGQIVGAFSLFLPPLLPLFDGREEEGRSNNNNIIYIRSLTP